MGAFYLPTGHRELDSGKGLSETLFVRALLELWKAVKKTGKKPDTETIMKAGGGLLATTAKQLTAAIGEGFKLAETEVSKELEKRLLDDVWVFSGLKTHAQLLEASEKLFEDGKVRPWSKFKNDVLDLHPKYNVHYLEAEYHHAVGNSQMAAHWEKFERQKDRYNLRYVAVDDGKTRASHKKLNGITLPVDHPFWKKYFPKNGWRCRCRVIQVPKTEPVTDSKTAMELGEEATTMIGKDGKNRYGMFRFNPGIDKAVFPPHHPYYEQKGKKEITDISKKEQEKNTGKDKK